MNINVKDIPSKSLEGLSKLKRYAVLIFLLLVAGVYGFLVLRIGSLQNAQPEAVSSNAQVTTVATPHIDKKVVDKLQQLQDNSVVVKALFDQARSNPFQE